MWIHVLWNNNQNSKHVVRMSSNKFNNSNWNIEWSHAIDKFIIKMINSIKSFKKFKSLCINYEIFDIFTIYKIFKIFNEKFTIKFSTYYSILISNWSSLTTIYFRLWTCRVSSWSIHSFFISISSHKRRDTVVKSHCCFFSLDRTRSRSIQILQQIARFSREYVDLYRLMSRFHHHC